MKNIVSKVVSKMVKLSVSLVALLGILYCYMTFVANL